MSTYRSVISVDQSSALLLVLFPLLNQNRKNKRPCQWRCYWIRNSKQYTTAGAAPRGVQTDRHPANGASDCRLHNFQCLLAHTNAQVGSYRVEWIRCLCFCLDL